MLPTILCWFLGALLLTVGLLATLYLTWLQIQQGVTTFSILATSDALATVAISIAFLINAANSQNSEARISMEPSQCSQGQLTLASMLFLAPFVHTFMSMMAHSAESLQSAQNGVEARGHEARKNPRLVSSVAAQWIVPAISTLVLFSAGIQHSRPYRADADNTCMEGTALTPIPVESMEQCLHQEDISDYITTLMNTHNYTTRYLPVNNTQSTDNEVAQVVDNIYKILQIHRSRRSSAASKEIQSKRRVDSYLTSVHERSKWKLQTSQLENIKNKIRNIQLLENNLNNANYKNTNELYKHVGLISELDKNNENYKNVNENNTNYKNSNELYTYVTSELDKNNSNYKNANENNENYKNANELYKHVTSKLAKNNANYKNDNKNNANYKNSNELYTYVISELDKNNASSKIVNENNANYKNAKELKTSELDKNNSNYKDANENNANYKNANELYEHVTSELDKNNQISHSQSKQINHEMTKLQLAHNNNKHKKTIEYVNIHIAKDNQKLFPFKNKHKDVSEFIDHANYNHPKFQIQSNHVKNKQKNISEFINGKNTDQKLQIQSNHVKNKQKNISEFINGKNTNQKLQIQSNHMISSIHQQEKRTSAENQTVNSKSKSQRRPRATPLENTPDDGDYYDTTDEYYDKGEESTSSEVEDESDPHLETTDAPLAENDPQSETPEPQQPLNTIQPETSSPSKSETTTEALLNPIESAVVTTETSDTTPHQGTETNLIAIQIPDTVNMCVVKCYLSDTFLKKYLFVLLFLCYFIPIIASLTMYFSTPSTQSIVEVKPSTAEESCTMQSSTTPSTTTVKHSILSSVLMWTPTLVETLLRAWLCVSSPQWLTALLFMLAQVHAIIRNSLNLRLVRKRACSGSVQPLTEAEDLPAKLFTNVKATILK